MFSSDCANYICSDRRHRSAGTFGFYFHMHGTVGHIRIRRRHLQNIPARIVMSLHPNYVPCSSKSPYVCCLLSHVNEMRFQASYCCLYTGTYTDHNTNRSESTLYRCNLNFSHISICLLLPATSTVKHILIVLIHKAFSKTTSSTIA